MPTSFAKDHTTSWKGNINVRILHMLPSLAGSLFASGQQREQLREKTRLPPEKPNQTRKPFDPLPQLTHSEGQNLGASRPHEHNDAEGGSCLKSNQVGGQTRIHQPKLGSHRPRPTSNLSARSSAESFSHGFAPPNTPTAHNRPPQTEEET